jgi:type I restriction enzyme S subunit
METNNQKNDQNIIPNDADKQQKGVNVPNLRFPNYNSAWQKNKFGNLLTLLKNNTLSRAELNYENGKIKDIHYGDVLIKFNDFVLSDSKIIPYINDDRIPHNYADLLLKTGDLVIADTAEDYTVGKATELIFNDQSLIISGLHTIPCRPINNNFGSKYLGYYINSPSFHNQLLPLIQGIKVSSISKSQIVDTFISYPKIDEQCKITEFLTLIDQRIDTQSKIIEDLELCKKKICYEIFSAKESYVKPLGSIISYGKAGGTPASTNKSYYNGNIPFLSISDMTEQGKYILKTEKTLSELGLKNSSAWLVPKNSLILSMYASVGFVSISKVELATSQAMFSMIIEDKNLLEYVYYYLNYFKSFKIHRLLETGTQSNINAEMVKNINIPFFDQTKNLLITQFFNNFDLKIKKEKDILELYKKQKAYLLKNMFI